jgi:hypothetical protein
MIETDNGKLAQTYQWLLLTFVLAFSFSIMLNVGTADVSLMIQKMNSVAANGLRAGFAGPPSREYPPLFSVMLLAPNFLANTFGISDVAAFKIFVFLIYILSVVLLIVISSDILVGLLFAAAFAYNAMALGYMDSWCAPFLFLSFYFLDRNKLALGILAYALACLVKLQPLIIGPFILLYAFRPQGIRQWQALPLRADVWRTAAAVAVLLMVFFAFFGNFISVTLQQGFAHSRSSLTANGLNVPLLSGLIYRLLASPADLSPNISNGIDIHDHPWVYLVFRYCFSCVYLLTLAAAIYVAGQRNRVLLLAVAAFWSYTMLSTGVHENHLGTAVIVAIYLAMRDRTMWPVATITAIMFNFNQLIFYYPSAFRDMTDASYALATIVSIASFIWLLYFCWTQVARSSAVTLAAPRNIDLMKQAPNAP